MLMDLHIFLLCLAEQLKHRVGLRKHRNVDRNRCCAVFTGGQGNPIGNGCVCIIVGRKEAYGVEACHSGDRIVSLYDLPSSFVWDNGVPDGSFCTEALGLRSCRFGLQNLPSIAAGICQIRPAEGSGGRINPIQIHINAFSGALDDRHNANAFPNIENQIQRTVCGDHIVAGDVAQIGGAGHDGNRSGQQNVCQTDPQRFALHDELIHHTGHGKTREIQHCRQVFQFPSCTDDGVRVAQRFQLYPAELHKIRNQQTNVIGVTGLETTSTVEVVADILIGLGHQIAGLIQIAHGHPNWPVGSTVDCGIAQSRSQIHIQQGYKTVRTVARRSSGGRQMLAEAPFSVDDPVAILL